MSSTIIDVTDLHAAVGTPAANVITSYIDAKVRDAVLSRPDWTPKVGDRVRLKHTVGDLPPAGTEGVITFVCSDYVTVRWTVFARITSLAPSFLEPAKGGEAERIAELEAENATLRGLAKKIGNAFMDLTPGGSEYFVKVAGDYFADADACKARVRDKLDSGIESIKKFVREAKDERARAEAAEARIAELERELVQAPSLINDPDRTWITKYRYEQYQAAEAKVAELERALEQADRLAVHHSFRADEAEARAEAARAAEAEGARLREAAEPIYAWLEDFHGYKGLGVEWPPGAQVDALRDALSTDPADQADRGADGGGEPPAFASRILWDDELRSPDGGTDWRALTEQMVTILDKYPPRRPRTADGTLAEHGGAVKGWRRDIATIASARARLSGEEAS